MRNIGDSIYLLRLERRLSQKELARRSGVPQPNISSIEKGRDFRVSTLYKLAAALDVSPIDLVGGIQAIDVNKKNLFERDNIEKLANNLSSSDQASEPLRQLSEALLTALSNKSGQKDLHLSWIKLRRTFSNEELDALFSRINKADERTSRAVSA